MTFLLVTDRGYIFCCPSGAVLVPGFLLHQLVRSHSNPVS